MQCLATFVQVSDLHIGEIDPRNGDATVSAVWATLHQNEPWFDGYLGHHGLAMKALARFIEQLRDKGDQPRLIVTGDFSRSGDAHDLGLANDFIGREVDLRPPAQDFVGLLSGTISERIPGNHDHWGGTPPPLGGNPSIALSTLGLRMPGVLAASLPMGVRVIFICVDSDADVAPRTWERVFAQGHFLTQLADRSAAPPRSSGRDIRVMLIHHSWHQRGLALRMRSDSRRELEDFVVKHDVCAMLTGHSHDPLLQLFTARGSSGSRDVWELRCGTTTQHDQRVPAQWAHLPNMNPWAAPLPPNNLLVHRVELRDDASIWWRCDPYQRTTSQAATGQPPTFAPVAGQGVEFQV